MLYNSENVLIKLKNTVKPMFNSVIFNMVERTRLELVTPTLPVSCATNCANAPCVNLCNCLTIFGGERSPPSKLILNQFCGVPANAPCGILCNFLRLKQVSFEIDTYLHYVTETGSQVSVKLQFSIFSY